MRHPYSELSAERKLELSMASIAMKHLLEKQPRTVAPVLDYIAEHLDEYDLALATAIYFECCRVTAKTRKRMAPACLEALKKLEQKSHVAYQQREAWRAEQLAKYKRKKVKRDK